MQSRKILASAVSFSILVAAPLGAAPFASLKPKVKVSYAQGGAQRTGVVLLVVDAGHVLVSRDGSIQSYCLAASALTVITPPASPAPPTSPGAPGGTSVATTQPAPTTPPAGAGTTGTPIASEGAGGTSAWPAHIPKYGDWVHTTNVTLKPANGQSSFNGIKGTASRPVVITGVDTTNKLELLNCEYVRVEGAKVNRKMQSSAVNIYGGHHVALLKFDVQQGEGGILIGADDVVIECGRVYDCTRIAARVALPGSASGSTGGTLGTGDTGASGTHPTMPDWSKASGDEDHHGIIIGDGDRLWIKDVESFCNEGDGIQINTEGEGKNIFVVNCSFHHNKQVGGWVKGGENVIFSGNKSFGHRPSGSGLGQGFGFQYGAKNVWFIGNESWNNATGFGAGSTDNGTNFWQRPSDGIDAWFVGNHVHDLAGEPDSRDAYAAGRDFAGWPNNNLGFVNNRFQRGVGYAGGRTVFETGNTFSTPAFPEWLITAGRHADLSSADLAGMKTAWKAAFGTELP